MKEMNKRDLLLSLVNDKTPPDSVPAAFFLHFDPVYHQGQAAIDRHLEFFRSTGMDFVKIQYEQPYPPSSPIRKPEDWARLPRVSEAYFEPAVRVAEGLVKAAKEEALVILTLYSPFMWLAHTDYEGDMADHFKAHPQAVKQGLEIVTENVRNLVRACKKVGIDGFYASSQGGEADRFKGTDIFRKYIKPADLAVWEEIGACPFNILHICDYASGYDDLTPFLDYPGQVVNCSLNLGDRTLAPKEVSQMFARPFMGGMERKGVIATGSPVEIRQAVENVLAVAPERFILAADCTVPGDTPWENLRAAIETAHTYR
jgi:uroporphyrinogen decarboxylase